jgi:hypothetical protein
MTLAHAEGKQASFRSPLPAQVASKCGILPVEQVRIEPSPQGGGFENMARRDCKRIRYGETVDWLFMPTFKS